MRTRTALALVLALALAGCGLVPYNARIDECVHGMQRWHLAMIDTCGALQAPDRGAIEASRAGWQKPYEEALAVQRASGDDKARREMLDILSSHFNKNADDLTTAKYPCSRAFIEGLRKQATEDYRWAIEGEWARDGSPYNAGEGGR
jgi:hypothetical protein